MPCVSVLRVHPTSRCSLCSGHLSIKPNKGPDMSISVNYCKLMKYFAHIALLVYTVSWDLHICGHSSGGQPIHWSTHKCGALAPRCLSILYLGASISFHASGAMIFSLAPASAAARHQNNTAAALHAAQHFGCAAILKQQCPPGGYVPMAAGGHNTVSSQPPLQLFVGFDLWLQLSSLRALRSTCQATWAGVGAVAVGMWSWERRGWMLVCA
jgi:hypothetical protein